MAEPSPTDGPTRRLGFSGEGDPRGRSQGESDAAKGNDTVSIYDADNDTDRTLFVDSPVWWLDQREREPDSDTDALGTIASDLIAEQAQQFLRSSSPDDDTDGGRQKRGRSQGGVARAHTL